MPRTNQRLERGQDTLGVGAHSLFHFLESGTPRHQILSMEGRLADAPHQPRTFPPGAHSPESSLVEVQGLGWGWEETEERLLKVLHLQSPLRPEELEVLSRGRTRLRGHGGSGGAGRGLPSNHHMHLAESAPWGGGATGSNIYTLPFAKELLLWMSRRGSILRGALGAPCSGVAGAVAADPWRERTLGPTSASFAVRIGAGQVLPVA